MRTRMTLATITAMTMAGVLTLNAQTPQRPNPQTPNPQTPTTQPQTDRQRPMTDTQRSGNDQAVTVTGCLKAEKDVPGRQPNAAERAGIGDDYILTNVKMGQSSPTSAMGLASMYQVKGISESELKKHMNHQIEVTGRVEASTTTRTTGNSDLPDLNATSIKMVAATCPAGQ